MPDYEFRKVPPSEIHDELKAAHKAINEAMAREDVDIAALTRACDWLKAVIAALDRKRRTPLT